MACCGGGSKQASRGIVNRGAISMRAQANLTSSDMVLLEYKGRNVGSTNYGGPGTAVSGRYYRFGGNQRDRIKYVDARDVQLFLEMRENGQRLFARAATAEPAIMPMRQVAPDPAASQQAAAVMPTDMVVQPADMVVQPEVSIQKPGARVIGQIDPNSLTFRELQALELAPEQWAELLDAEIEGKGRSSVVNLIKERANAVLA